MIGSYGSYSWDFNSTTVSHGINIQWNAGDQPYSAQHKIDVEGYLSFNGQAAGTIAINLMYAAMKKPYQNLVLSIDSGADSFHSLRNTPDCISGVRITSGPLFDKTTGAEYNTERFFKFTAEAEYILAGTQNFLIEFEETLSFSGGGPLYDIKPALVGPPQKQLLFEQTPYVCIQSGHSVGYTQRPNPMPPLFPDALMKSPDVRKVSPRRRGRGYQNFGISWNYEFKSIGPLSGEPNRWLG